MTYEEDINLLVKLVKTLLKAPNDPMWDKGNLGKITRGVRQLYNMFKKSPLREYESLLNITGCCIQEIAEEQIKYGLEWSVAGVVQRKAYDWHEKKLKEMKK